MTVTVKFNADIDESFYEELRSIVDHKIGCLINLDEFLEIQRIFGAVVVEGENAGS